ncbi:MAG TPA: DNA-processing protein DprA [Usitatibacter sp.]|nr:DNA-processing protein DprA [Usitatibacter sp.]
METTEWNDESEALLRLACVQGIGPVKQREILEALGTACAAWRATTDEVAARVEPAVARCLKRGCDERAVDRALRWREATGHHVVAWNSSRYPPLLREIADPPLVLYAKGDTARLAGPSLAIVGSRNATAQGRRDAFDFAAALSHAGLCIVSGMALGIDGCAHEGGLAGPGSSIAVLGTDIDTIYPQAHRKLAERLEREGCIVSDFELGTPALKGNFPARNRLISGLARGVLVVEAALESGSLITAKCGLEQNRDVFAMPGSIHSPLSKGAHALIRSGAKITECVDDILVELRMLEHTRMQEPERSRADPLLDAMGFAPISLEQLASLSGMGVDKIAAGLSRLELEGRVAPLTGGLFQRTSRASPPR